MTHKNEFQASGTSPTENRRGIIGPISTTVWRNARKRVRKANPTVEKSNRQSSEVDFYCENHGSIFLLRPVSLAALSWIKGNLPADHMKFGGAVVVEHRYIADIVHGAQADGLVVRP